MDNYDPRFRSSFKPKKKVLDMSASKVNLERRNAILTKLLEELSSDGDVPQAARLKIFQALGSSYSAPPGRRNVVSLLTTYVTHLENGLRQVREATDLEAAKAIALETLKTDPIGYEPTDAVPAVVEGPAIVAGPHPASFEPIPEPPSQP